jgi:hypothetical protein
MLAGGRISSGHLLSGPTGQTRRYPVKFRDFARRAAKILAVVLILAFGVSAVAKTKFKVLYNFKDVSDGGNPVLFTALTIDGNGNLLGAAQAGGDIKNNYCEGYGCGVVFKL